MGCMFFWTKIGAIIQYKYLNRGYFDCKTKLCLGKQEKYIFTQAVSIHSFYPQLGAQGQSYQ